MKNKLLIKLLNIGIILFISASLQCCTEKDKQIVLTDNMKENINFEEDQVLDLIRDGNSYLNNNDFNKAKECYEKAISMDKTNESTYLKIKDSYINEKRYDDAYYIIKLAIDNNVSKDSMNNILEDIKTHFSPTLMAASIYQGENYTLPSKVTLSINEVDTQVAVNWNDAKVDISNVGTFQFEGYCDQYGRTVNLNLKVSEKPNKSIEEPKKPTNLVLNGYITDFYDKYSNTYIAFDDIDFFDTPEKAKEEYQKDYNEPALFEWGNYYYYRNPSEESKTYKLSPNTTFKLCDYIIHPEANSIDLTEVSIDTFKQHVKLRTASDSGLIYRITISNNIVSDISMIFIP